MFGELHELTIDISRRKRTLAMVFFFFSGLIPNRQIQREYWKVVFFFFNQWETYLGRCFPRAFRGSNGVLLLKLHHRKVTLKLKKGQFQRKVVFQPLFSRDMWVFGGVFSYFLPGSGRGNPKPPRWFCQEGQLANSQPSPLPRPPKVVTRQDWICRASNTKNRVFPNIMKWPWKFGGVKGIYTPCSLT